MKTTPYQLLYLAAIFFVGCSGNTFKENANLRSAPVKESSHAISQEFKDYWYAGNAEINRYELEQARYGEIHKGDAVLIFVTEDFMADKQVKFEGGETDEDIVSVLKLNFLRKFNTGIYPYSIMSSVFTPVDFRPTLKVTASIQEWCGQTFAQINRRGNTYEAQLFSYFMNEADKKIELEGELLEDEVWTKLRLAPDLLPTGEIELIPGFQFLRMAHRDFKVEKAIASMSAYENDSVSDKSLKLYSIDYKNFNRKLEIVFENAFPHSILEWRETGDAGFGQTGLLTTRAVRTHILKEPYWSQNSVADSTMRKKLGLKN